MSTPPPLPPLWAGELLALVRVSEPALPPPPPSPFLPLSSPALLELLPGQALLSCTAEWALPRVSLGEEASLTLRLASSLAVPLSPSSLRLAASGADLSGDLSAAVAKLAAQSAAPHGGEAAPRLCIPAGGELLLEVSHSAGAVGTVAPKQLELVLGETPCAIVLILPLSAPPPRNGAAAPPPEAAPALLQVTPPPPAVQLTFQGAQPVLVGEVAPLCVSLDARSDGIADGTLSLSAAGPTSAPPQAATGTSPGPAPRAEAAEKEAAEAEALEPELLDEGGAAPLAHPLSLPPVVRDECHRVRLLLRAVRPGAVRLQALLEYAPAGGGARAETVVSAMVEAVPAVEVRCEYLFSPTRTARGSLARDEPLCDSIQLAPRRTQPSRPTPPAAGTPRRHLLVTASCLAPLAAGLVLHSLEARPSLVAGALPGTLPRTLAGPSPDPSCRCAPPSCGGSPHWRRCRRAASGRAATRCCARAASTPPSSPSARAPTCPRRASARWWRAGRAPRSNPAPSRPPTEGRRGRGRSRRPLWRRSVLRVSPRPPPPPCRCLRARRCRLRRRRPAPRRRFRRWRWSRSSLIWR